MNDDTTMGRPTKYDDTAVLTALSYATSFADEGDAIPTVAHLSILLGVSRSTVYLWAKEHADFSDALDLILAHQEQKLINDGLTGKFTPAITKLLLHGHGHSDRQELDHRSGDGSMTPRTLDDFYAATNEKPNAKSSTS